MLKDKFALILAKDLGISGASDVQSFVSRFSRKVARDAPILEAIERWRTSQAKNKRLIRINTGIRVNDAVLRDCFEVRH